MPGLKAGRPTSTRVGADIYLLFTAAHLHICAYELWVPWDVVVSLADEGTAWALDIMREVEGVEVRAPKSSRRPRA